jgi:hypothetical protein
VSSQAAAIETDTLTASVATATNSTAVTIDPTPKFYFKGDTQEMSVLADGAAVTATLNPSGWTGALTVRGNGYVAMDPVSGASGVSFHTGGAQNANTAYVNFSSPDFGTVINNSSEISFLLKSAYSFTERKALPASNQRSAFEVYDSTCSWYGFNTYTTAGGQLQLAFAAKGYSGVYTVPAGQEDVLFGKGVIVKIKITWTPTQFSLWINDKLIKTNNVSVPKTAVWSSTSAFTIGSRSARLSGGGYYSSDDTVAEFMMR